MKKLSLTILLLLAPAIIILSLSLVAPAFLLAREAITTPVVPGTSVTGDVLLKVQAVTMKIAFLVALGATFLALATAIASRNLTRRGKLIVLALSLFPTGVHIIFRAFGVQTLLGPEGPLNNASRLLSIEPPSLLFTETATILGLIHWTFPVSFLALFLAVMHLPEEIRVAAELLGAPKRAIFLRVEFPQLLPAIVLSAGLVFCLAYGSFITPAILGGLEDITLSRLIGSLLSEGQSSEATVPALIGAITPLLVFAAISLIVRNRAER